MICTVDWMLHNNFRDVTLMTEWDNRKDPCRVSIQSPSNHGFQL